MNEVIYGLCDKTGECDIFIGFFKHLDPAQKEMKNVAKRLIESGQDIVVYGERIVKKTTEREEEILFIIHPYILRK